MNITTATAELTAMLQNVNINNVSYPYGVFNRAKRQLLSDVDAVGTKKVASLGTIFNGIFDYIAPIDLKDMKIIDIRPQSNRSGVLNRSYSQYFDINKGLENLFGVKMNSGVRTLKISNVNAPAPIVINNASAQNNGTWAGTVLNITTDNINYINGGALKFDLDAIPASYIENSTMNAIDLTEHANQSTIFFYVYLQRASGVKSIELRWGSDSTNYYSVTNTTTQEGLAFQNGWNLIKCAWEGATKVGSPVNSAINYIKITLNTDSTSQTGCKINYLTSNMGEIMETEYYSSFIFKDTLGAFKSDVTSNEDEIVLDEQALQLYLYLLASYGSQQVQGRDASYNVSYFEAKYQDGLKRYNAQHKSEAIKVQDFYYKTRKPYRI